MSYDAKVIEILIASPGDVVSERGIVREVIADWNAVYARDRKIVLMPIGWDTHSSPDLSGRPQQMINDRLLAHADLLVGIFWNRVGSATGKAISGSVEEIEEHLKKQKPVMLYFSKQPIAADSVDHSQYNSLKNFKSWAKERGLVEEFDSLEEFRGKFQKHMPITLKDNQYIKGIMPVAPIGGGTGLTNILTLSEDERSILMAAAEAHGIILKIGFIGGTSIQTGNKKFGDSKNSRSIAKWEAIIDKLRERGMMHDKSGKGEFFSITDLGYQAIETGT